MTDKKPTDEEIKNCPYCHEDNGGYMQMFGAFALNYSPFYKGWFLHAGKCKPRAIKYCPMCGRKLKGDNDEQ